MDPKERYAMKSQDPKSAAQALRDYIRFQIIAEGQCITADATASEYLLAYTPSSDGRSGRLV